jgi:hypothetical protein
VTAIAVIDPAERGAIVADIVMTAAITAMMAGDRAPAEQERGEDLLRLARLVREVGAEWGEWRRRRCWPSSTKRCPCRPQLGQTAR